MVVVGIVDADVVDVVLVIVIDVLFILSLVSSLLLLLCAVCVGISFVVTIVVGSDVDVGHIVVGVRHRGSVVRR